MKITNVGAAYDPQFERVDTPRTDAHYKQILDDDLGLEYNETELRYWAEKLERELAEVKEQLRLCNVDQFRTAAELANVKDDFDTAIEQRDKLMLMNTDPSSFMSYQEGAEAGRLAERERCAKVSEEYPSDLHTRQDQCLANEIAAAIRKGE